VGLDHLVITGDLTNIALVQEFTLVEEWLHSLGSAERVTVIPGNHDAYVAVPWKSSLAKWQAFMTDEPSTGEEPRLPSGPDAFPFVRFRGPVAILGLNSAQPTPLFCAHGTLGESQLYRLGELLQKLGQEDWFRVVLLHHPPSLEGIARRKRLIDAEPFREVISEHGAELILHGHGHTFDNMHIAAGTRSVPVLGVPSASAAQRGKKPQAHYQIYEIMRDADHWRIEVTARGFDPASGRFVEARRYRI
jgi:3',5'-cyclic AMP phosphodiesterase CpdA